MLHMTEHVTGGIRWANMHLLFWLSLIPFGTAWMGESGFQEFPIFTYGVVLIMAALSYTLLQLQIIKSQGPESPLKKAVGADKKGKASLALYAAGLATALYVPALAGALYVAVALIWLIPDRRIEDRLGEPTPPAAPE